jgi:hypothetical protein
MIQPKLIAAQAEHSACIPGSLWSIYSRVVQSTRLQLHDADMHEFVGSVFL